MICITFGYLAKACEMCESYGQKYCLFPNYKCNQSKKWKISQQEKRQKNISKPYTLASLLFTTTYVSKWSQNLYRIANFINNKSISNSGNIHKWFNPNWHEGWYFYLLVIFGSDFVSCFFIKTFQTCWRWKLTSSKLFWHPA